MSICKLYHTGITSIGKLYHTPTSCGAASYLDATYTCLYPRIKRTVPVSRIRLLHCELHAQQSHTSQAPLPTEPSNMSVGKLYYTPTSCGAASYLAATYADLHFDSEIVDLKAHKTASGQDFYQINPKGNVPTLVTPDGMLSEGPAILQYIADHAPQSKLALGAFGTYERYHLIDTFNYVGSEVHKAFSPLFKYNPLTSAACLDQITISSHQYQSLHCTFPSSIPGNGWTACISGGILAWYIK